MLNNIFQKTLRDQLNSIFWWSVGFVLISIYFCYLFPFISNNKEMIKMIDSLPPIIKNMLGDIEFMTSPAGFFHLQPFSFSAPIMIVFYSISKGVNVVAGEKEGETLDLLLSNPISRTKMIYQKVISISLALLIIHFFFFAGMVLGIELFAIKLSIFRLMEAIVSLYVLSISFLTISVSVGVIFLNKRIAIGFLSGFTLITFIANAYGSAIKSLQIVVKFSPFYYNSGNSPIINGLDATLILIQLIIAISFFILSIVTFNKRDLYS